MLQLQRAIEQKKKEKEDLLVGSRWGQCLACFSHHLTAEARNRPAITSLRLLTVLTVGFKYARIIQEMPR